MVQCCWVNNAVEPDLGSKEPYDTDSNNEVLSSKNRSCTDVFYVIIFLVFIIGLASLFGYSAYHGDVYRILNGYDDCANVCGRPNGAEVDAGSSCKREDMTSKRFLVINAAGEASVQPNNIHRECVESCDYTLFREFINRCIPNKSETIINTFFSKTGLSNFFQEVTEDLHLCWMEILYLCLIAFVFSVIILVLLRFAAGFMIWTVLIAVSLTSVIGTIFLWIMWSREKEELQSTDQKNQDNVSKIKVKSYLAYAIVSTVVSAIILLVIFVLRKRVKLVAQLFREAGKAISSMPFLLFEPALTFFAFTLTVGLWVYLSVWVESAGFLSLETNQSLHYRKDMTMKVTRWYNLFALFWFTQFLIGCQHMVVAGAVATWFFTRNKHNLNMPIAKSLNNLIRFHLGTVLFGSLIIAIFQILRVLLKYLETSLKKSTNCFCQGVFRCIQCCLGCFEQFLKYLTRNAYIETALYGFSFCHAGKQAMRLLGSNGLRVAAINSVGDFILFLAKAFVVMATVLIGIEIIQKKEGVQHVWIPLSIAGVVAYLTAHCFMTVYEMAIDTIFICFCEDCEKNDGIGRPYYMSRGLMEYVQNSKKVLEGVDTSDQQAWASPKTISENVK